MPAESGLLGPLLSLEELSRLRRKLGLGKCVPKKTLKQCVPTAPCTHTPPEYESELHDVVCIGEKRGLRNASPLCETRSQSSDNSLAYSPLLWLKVLHATVGLTQCATMEHNMGDASEKRWKWRGSAAWSHAPPRTWRSSAGVCLWRTRRSLGFSLGTMNKSASSFSSLVGCAHYFRAIPPIYLFRNHQVANRLCLLNKYGLFSS